MEDKGEKKAQKRLENPSITPTRKYKFQRLFCFVQVYRLACLLLPGFGFLSYFWRRHAFLKPAWKSFSISFLKFRDTQRDHKPHNLKEAGLVSV